MSGPFLILAPLSTLAHWKKSFDDWSYMNSVCYYDEEGKQGREYCRSKEWFRKDVTQQGTLTEHFKIMKFNVLISSFEVFIQDYETVFQELPIQHIIIDEAHRLKNKNAKLLGLLREMICTRVTLLTGTPIQNNLQELWCLLNYIEPQTFPSQEDFQRQFSDLNNMGQLDALKARLEPYMLRRMKEDVERSIPPLQETILDIEMTNLQKVVYKTIYEKNKGTLQQGLGLKYISIMNNLEMQLRKCCNHPYLIQDIRDNLLGEVQTAQEYFDKMKNSSCKMVCLDKLIKKYQGLGKKLLIFSQFTEMLAIIEEYLIHEAIQYEKIDGSTKAKDRQ